MNIPKPLIDDISAGKCLPFIGAGFSLNASLPKKLKMPAWPELTEILAKTAGVSLGHGGPHVASEFERKFGKVQLIEEIRRALHIGEAEPGESHKAFAELPFETIYTTNFDLLLEDSYNLIHRPFRSLVGERQMPFHGGPFTTNIVKMHGDLRHEEKIVVTQEDYEKYLEDNPAIATHLSAMLITRTALFIGYSLNDPDFQNIRNVVRSRLGKFERMSYIVQFNKSPDYIESKLDDKLHVISISADSDDLKDSKLADLFKKIQKSLDINEGIRFRAARPIIFEDIAEETFEKIFRLSDSQSLLTSSSNLCFMIMPFNSEFDVVYRSLIKPAVEKFGLTTLRADEMYSTGQIMEQIRAAIQQSRLCIADLSYRNPNVLYELGISQTLGKPIILITNNIDDVPFDLRSDRFIVYDVHSFDSINKARIDLERTIQLVLGEDRLNEAQRLINNGMYRAAVAILGILLEHSFRQLIAKNMDKLSERLKKQTPINRPLSLGKALHLLENSNIILPEESSKLSECVLIRNKAIHELEEPKFNDANFMLKLVKEFIENYLKSNFTEETL